MKILVVGGGGREHAIAWKINQSKRVNKIYCAPGNAGTAQIAENLPIAADDVNGLLNFAKKEKIDFTIVGPEIPLVNGIVDLFTLHGLKIFGPAKSAAELEASKLFMKEVAKKAGVPTAEFKSFTDCQAAIDHLKNRKEWPQVVKADGLAAGKGVCVAEDLETAEKFVNSVMSEKIFGDSGNSVVIESFLDGEEASYIVVSDGKNFVPLAHSQDHKRAFDGDKGPNTGGMGAYSPAPVITPEIEERVKKKIIKPMIDEMHSSGKPFRGFLYAGLMIKDGVPSVLEFNVRLGDPEAQPLLSRYRGDLLDLLEAAAEGDLTGVKVEWQDNAAVCIVIASGGYPGSYEKGKVIEGLDSLPDNVTVFHAGTKTDGGNVVTSGGRVLGVTATAGTIEEAQKLAYSAAEKIKWEGSFYRKDIANRAINR